MPNDSAQATTKLEADLPRLPDIASTLRMLRRGASRALLVQIGGAGLGLISHVVIARVTGKAEYGVYTFVLTWVNVLSVVALLGQSSSVVRFVPGYIHGNLWGLLRGLRRGASAIALLSSCVMMLAGALIVYLIRGRLSVSLELTLLAGFASLPVLTQLQLNGAFFQGFKHAGSSSGYNRLLRPIFLIVLVLLFGALLRFRFGAPAVMLASILAAIGALVISEWRLTRVWPAPAKQSRPAYEMRSWLVLGQQLFFVAILAIVLNRVDVLILGGLVGATMVGPYYAAVQIASVAIYGINAVNTMLAPMIAESHAVGDTAALSRMVRHAAKLIFVVTAICAVAAVVLGRWVLNLFGHGFAASAYLPLLILLVGQCVSAAVGPVGYIMTMTRFEREAPLFMGAGALLNVLLSVALIPCFGLIGAAIASAESIILWNLAALVFVRRKLGINPTILPLPSRSV